MTIQSSRKQLNSGWVNVNILFVPEKSTITNKGISLFTTRGFHELLSKLREQWYENYLNNAFF